MKNQEFIESVRPKSSIISILLGIAVVVTTTAYLISRHMRDKAYRRKWKDYEDCGLM